MGAGRGQCASSLPWQYLPPQCTGADKAMQNQFGVLHHLRSEKQEVAEWFSPCFLDAWISDRFLCEGLPKSSMELECQT